MAFMTDEELRDTVKAAKEFAAELSSSPEKARAYFIETGAMLPSGEWAPEWLEAHLPLA